MEIKKVPIQTGPAEYVRDCYHAHYTAIIEQMRREMVEGFVKWLKPKFYQGRYLITKEDIDSLLSGTEATPEAKWLDRPDKAGKYWRARDGKIIDTVDFTDYMITHSAYTVFSYKWLFIPEPAPPTESSPETD